MKKNLFLITALVLSSGMVSCSSSEVTAEDPDEPKTVVYMMADPQPIKLTEAQMVFANDNNQFTLNFLKTVNDVDMRQEFHLLATSYHLCFGNGE